MLQKPVTVFKLSLRGILAANLIRGGVTAVTEGLRGAIVEFANFDDAMISAAARFSDIGPKARDFNDQVRKLKGQAREFAAGTKYTTAEVGNMWETLSISGFKSAAAIGMTRDQMALATATGEELNQVTSWTVDLLKSLYPRTNDAATKIRYMNEMTNALTNVTLGANVSLEDMYEALKMVGSVGKKANAPAKDMIAYAGVLGDAAIKGTRAETAFKNMYLRLVDPTISKQLKDRGIDMADDQKNMLPLIDILSQIQAKTKSMGTMEATGIWSLLFGKLGFAGAASLAEAEDLVTSFLKIMQEQQDIAQVTADRQEKSLLNRTKKLGSALLEAAFRVFDPFEDRMRVWLDKTTVAIGKFNPMPVIQSLDLLFWVLKAGLEVLKLFRPVLKEVIYGFLTFKATLIALPLLSFIGEMIMLTKWFGIAEVATWAFDAAVTALNGVMAASPFGWVPLAIAAAVAGLVYLERKFGVVTIAVKGAWEILKLFFKTLRAVANFLTPKTLDPSQSSAAAWAERYQQLGGSAVSEPKAPKPKNKALHRSSFCHSLG